MALRGQQRRPCGRTRSGGQRWGSYKASGGQTLKATILGTITDSSHAVIPSVQVSLTETTTNFHRTETTNDSGFYAFTNLDPGNYRVEVEHPGFRKTVRAGIDLVPNTTVRVDLELQPGAVTETVDVTAEAPLLQTDRADTGGKVESIQLTSLPMLWNRNYQNLLQVVPGVGRSYRSNSQFFDSQDHLQSVVNGLDQRNNYMIEGVDNNVENLTGIIVPADAIAVVDTTTSNYDPELGRAGGAVVNVIMKSGTNDFHGSAFEYHYDNDMQAKNVFASTTPHAVYNQFGGSLGGRIKRDKLFFFGDYQGSRDRKGNTNLPTIPTMAFRAGDLSGSPTTIYDPLTGSASGAGRTPFPNNQIPTARISSITQQYLSFLPAPTRPGFSANFEKPTSTAKAIDQFDVKIDYVITANDRMFVRYNFQRALVDDPGLYGPGGIYGGPHNSGFQGTGPSRNQAPGINYSHIFSPTLVTEARFGIVRNRNDATNPDTGLPLSQKLGIPNANLGDMWTSGLAEVYVDGYDTPMIGVNGCLPWRRSVTNFDWVNNWTKTKGNHVIKWGADIRRERQDLLQTPTFSPRGRFTFTAGPTANPSDPKTSFGNSFAAFLLDQPNGVGRDLAFIFPARRNTIYNLYFQDKWQVTQKLTLDLGLRWEFWPSSTPHFPAGFSNYNPFNNTLELAGIGSIPNNLGIQNQPKSFAPRFGAAYRLNDKTVFRGGYGISYLPRTTNVYNFPVNQNQQLTAPNSFSAAGSMAQGFPAPIAVAIPSTGVITNPPNSTFTYVAKDRYQTYVESWNVAIQRSLPRNFAVDLAYVGNHTVNNGITWNINAGRVPGAGPAGQPLNQLFGRTAETDYSLPTHAFYDAFQLKINRRFSGGLLLTTAYAYGKAIDIQSNFNNINPLSQKGPTSFDRRHVFTQSFLYDLPFGPGKRWAHSGLAKWIIGGWQVNGLVTAESGFPFSITFSSATLNAPGNSNRPNVSGPVAVLGNIGPGQLFFDTSKFSAPAPGTFGNTPRNFLYGPKLFSIDSSLVRKFRITERITGELQGQAINLTNTPHFDNPGASFGSSSFGQVTTAQGNQTVKVNENRQLEVSLRFVF
ncbi:MAG TPA: TonB-dependent receptor [Bryobacterales bacterium]|nr:TonB-dependent receptor [Bryobacterales bacterium]